MNFDEAFDALLGREGGYVDSRADPGGETKFGISKRSYPGEDIRNLTLDRAKEIYRRDFWGPCGADALGDPLRFQVFDMAVNSGVKASIRTLQASCDATVDGVLGPKTLLAVQSMPMFRIVARFNAQRLSFMAELPQWPSFGRGWAKRIAKNLELV